jgi:hypothetical protein
MRQTVSTTSLSFLLILSRESKTKDLHNFGLKGHLPNFIKIFLSNRNFNVRIGSIFSDNFDQEMGFPQGSILSVTLFSIKINSLTEVLKTEFQGSLYVDDFVLCYKSKNMNSTERKLQLCLNKIGRIQMSLNFLQ